MLKVLIWSQKYAKYKRFWSFLLFELFTCLVRNPDILCGSDIRCCYSVSRLCAFALCCSPSQFLSFVYFFFTLTTLFYSSQIGLCTFYIGFVLLNVGSMLLSLGSVFLSLGSVLLSLGSVLISLNSVLFSLGSVLLILDSVPFVLGSMFYAYE